MLTPTNPLATSPEVRNLVLEMLRYRGRFSRVPLMGKDQTVAAFRQELQVALRLDNPNVVKSRPV